MDGWKSNLMEISDLKKKIYILEAKLGILDELADELLMLQHKREMIDVALFMKEIINEEG